MRTTTGWCLVVVGLVSVGCNEHPLKDVRLQSVSTPTTVVDITPRRDVDILFVIDNSGSMGEEQATLADNFGALTDVLEEPSVDANYRIGITTTDNGHTWCPGTGPEGGNFVLESCLQRLEQFVSDAGGARVDVAFEACEALCPAALADLRTTPSSAKSGDPSLEPRPWLERLAGTTNLPEGVSMAEAFACMGPQGIDGCGFESPLEAMRRALIRAMTDGEDEYGFLRDESMLAVVFITDEADCSMQAAGEAAFDPKGDRALWSDPEGDYPTSAVCWNAGVQCHDEGGQRRCEPADLDAEGQPAQDPQSAVLHPVDRYLEVLDGLERDVLVAVIGGVADGYPNAAVEYGSGGDPQFVRDYGSAPGCASSSGVAVPPVRLRAVAESFSVADEPPLLFSICDADYRPALEAIADQIRRSLEPACVDLCPADEDAGVQGYQPWCVFTQSHPDGSTQEVPLCLDEGGASRLPQGARACAYPRVDSAACGDRQVEFELVRANGASPPAGSTVEATCVASPNPQATCGWI